MRSGSATFNKKQPGRLLVENIPLTQFLFSKNTGCQHFAPEALTFAPK
jgi:hypothetical protein